MLAYNFVLITFLKVRKRPILWQGCGTTRNLAFCCILSPSTSLMTVLICIIHETYQLRLNFSKLFSLSSILLPPTICGIFSACLTTFVFLKILSKVDCLPLLNYLPNWSHVINLLQSFPPGSVVRWRKDMMRGFWVILLAPLLNRFHLCWILFQMKRPTYLWSWWCIKT